MFMKGTGLATWPCTFPITNSARQNDSVKLVPPLQKTTACPCVWNPGVRHASNMHRCEDSLHQVEYPDGSENPVTRNIIVIT